MTSPRSLTSPCKGEVGREAAGRGSKSKFSRTAQMTKRARRLRRCMTDAEAKLWHALRRNQLDKLNFRRQHPVGSFTLDFYCPSLRLGIELDGGQYAEKDNVTKDRQRTARLASKGILVIRFWNNDVLGNLSGVLEEIVLVATNRTKQSAPPSPTLPLSGGGSRGAAS
jgi:very-short-patch-repair endonuclease